MLARSPLGPQACKPAILQEAGHASRATINSDDLAYFPGYMNENLIAVQGAAQLTRDEIVRLAGNAFKLSWLPQEDRAKYLDALETYAAKPG